MPDGFDAQTADGIGAAEITDYRTSPGIGQLFDALAKAQGEIRNAAKDSANPHFKSRYADLAAIAEACRPALSKHGIAVVQIPHNDGKDIAVTTMLGHSSGEWISGKLKVQPMKFDAQGVGSVVTYLRRYALAAMAGVAPGDDDDGEAGSGRGADNGDRTEIGAPSSGHAASKPTGRKPPPPAEADDVSKARAEFSGLKKAIAAAPHVDALDSLLDVANEKLAFIRQHGGEEAYKTLLNLAEQRRAGFGTNTMMG